MCCSCANSENKNCANSENKEIKYFCVLQLCEYILIFNPCLSYVILHDVFPPTLRRVVDTLFMHVCSTVLLFCRRRHAIYECLLCFVSSQKRSQTRLAKCLVVFDFILKKEARVRPFKKCHVCFVCFIFSF